MQPAGVSKWEGSMQCVTFTGYGVLMSDVLWPGRHNQIGMSLLCVSGSVYVTDCTEDTA